MAEKNVSLKQGEGQSYWMLNGLYTVKASADETGGTVSIVEMTLPEGWGPPTHQHSCAESMYVLEGAVRLHLGDDVVEYGPGSFFHIPAGTWERPEPIGTTRILAVYSPGGMDEFFAEAGEPATAADLPPMSDEAPDLERLVRIGERFGMRMQPPSGV